MSETCGKLWILIENFNLNFFFLSTNRRYYDPSVLAYQSDRMPEPIKLKVGGVDSSQFAVYEEFARNIPGFQAMSERDAALFIPKASLPVREF